MTPAPPKRARATRPLLTATRLLLLVCLLSCLTLTPAQSPAPPPQGATAQPTGPLVRLNLIVTDEAGHSVADVRREEISIFEDGRPQTVTHFAREEMPVSYGLVLDNSNSVTPLLDTIRRAGATIAAGNKAGDETFVVRFVDTTKIEEFQDFTSDPELLADALSRLYTESGQTAVVDATYLAVEKAAARRKGETGRRRAVVLISDCEDRMSTYRRDALFKLLRRESVQVFIISFLDKVSNEGSITHLSPREEARKLAEKIAEESGGRVFFPKRLTELAAAVEEISRDLRSQYVVGYAPTNAKAGGKFRKVEVKLAESQGRAKRRVAARPGYLSEK